MAEKAEMGETARDVRRLVCSLRPLNIGAEAAAEALRRRLSRVRDVDVSATVAGHVRHWAESTPEGPALVGEDGTLTYRQLARRVAAVRDRLARSGCRAGEVVAAVGPRSALSVIVLLALESLGAVYLPVDPAWPQARQETILRQSRAGHVLGYQAGGALPVPTAKAAATAGVPGLVLSEVDDSGTGDPLRSRCADPGEPRYVCFTSGTTGRPKGSLIDHQGMINHLWAKVLDVGMRGDDVLAFTAPPTFDIAIWQMLTPFLLGGTIVVFDELTMSFPRRVLRRLAETGTTAVELVPTMLGWLADVLARPGAAGLPGLRSIMSTGEELGTRLAGRLLEALPGVRLINAYGFTETSDDVTHHVVAPADLRRTRLPVGSPVINTALYVLVPDGPSWRAARPGEPGELFVGGRAPGHGYLDDDRATAAAFFADVIDPGSPTGRLYRTGDGVVVDEGVLCYLGRLDRQVKVSGVRMELGEIEAVLKGHPALAGCAVLAVGEGDERELVAYYVPRTGCDEEQLRDYLADRLPVAMIPRRWHAREELPVSANGKTDYQALRAG